jgi:phenylalanine-4-hydroxylase
MIEIEDFNNHQVKKLPNHLRQYIIAQNYIHYTSINQAVWRYVMRQNYSYLKDVAYYPYIKGLARAGLSIEKIPDLQTMNDNLGKIGWGAVTVDGFIPPVAFMEFQADQVLVIAAEILDRLIILLIRQHQILFTNLLATLLLLQMKTIIIT